MITFKQVSKSYGAQEILRNAAFFIGDGERVGIVGPNGAGKSTVFHLITGELGPDAGTVETPPQARIAHLRQEFNPQDVSAGLLEYAESGRPELGRILAKIHTLESGLASSTGKAREKLLRRIGEHQTRFERSGGYELNARAQAALCGLGFAADAMDRPFREFSGGWQMRAELARVLIAEPDILLLDEPTNYLDLPAVEWLQKFLRGFAGTLVLISHDRYLLNSLTRHTIEIANAEATRYAGNYDFYVSERKARYEQRLAAAKNQQRERERQQRFIDRYRAENTRSAQVQSRIKMLEKMEIIEPPQQALSPGTIRLKKPARAGQEIVRLEQAGATYDGEHWVLREIDLSIQRGEKLAVVGLNGMGKTTLLRLLAGRMAPAAGKRVLGHKVAVGYQSQEFAETMAPGKTLLQTVKEVGGASEQECRTLLGGFGFSGDTVEKKIQILSGGEKVRVAFARLLIDPPNFLVLDEPTTHLDVAAREALEHALVAFEGTICLVSHDVEFVRHVADAVVAMVPPGIRRYAGGYDDYKDKLENEAAQDDAADSKAADRPAPTGRKADRRKRAQRVQEQSRRRKPIKAKLERVEKKVDELEQERTELAAALSAQDAKTDYETVQRRLSQIQRELDKNTRLWERYAYELELVEREFADGT